MTDTERKALCARIDELCVENEKLRADQAHWELGNCPSCPNIADLQEALEQNAKLCQQLADVTESMGRVEERCAKLREQVDYMTPIALYAASEQERDRMRELGVDA